VGHSSETVGNRRARNVRAQFVSDSGLRSEAGWLPRLSGDRVLEVKELWGKELCGEGAVRGGSCEGRELWGSRRGRGGGRRRGLQQGKG
jgi:hypothetical protein